MIKGLKVVVTAVHGLTSRWFVKSSKIAPQNGQHKLYDKCLNLPHPCKEVQKWPLDSFSIVLYVISRRESKCFSNMLALAVIQGQVVIKRAFPFAHILPRSSCGLTVPFKNWISLFNVPTALPALFGLLKAVNYWTND